MKVTEGLYRLKDEWGDGSLFRVTAAEGEPFIRISGVAMLLIQV